MINGYLCIFFAFYARLSECRMFISSSGCNDGASECCRIFSRGSRHGRRNDGALLLVSLNMQQLFPYLQRHVVLSRRFVTLRNGPYLVPLTESRTRYESGEFSARKLVRRSSATLLLYTSLNMQELFPYVTRYVTHEIVRVKWHERIVCHAMIPNHLSISREQVLKCLQM